MTAAAATARLPARALDAFALALRDPRVVGAAASLNVDLSDRRTLQRLAARARAVLEPDVARAVLREQPADRVDIERLAAITDHHARAAIRTYLEVSRMAGPSQ